MKLTGSTQPGLARRGANPSGSGQAGHQDSGAGGEYEHHIQRMRRRGKLRKPNTKQSRKKKLRGIVSIPNYAHYDGGLGKLMTKEVLNYDAQENVFADE